MALPYARIRWMDSHALVLKILKPLALNNSCVIFHAKQQQCLPRALSTAAVPDRILIESRERLLPLKYGTRVPIYRYI